MELYSQSNDEFHIQQFKQTIDNLKKASAIGKNIVYKFGYSNFTFDLWIILHKMDCNGPKTDGKQYINSINRAYNKHFLSMDDYKHYDHFKSCLEQLSIDNVKKAIERSKGIMESNQANGYQLQRYKGYSFYRENPSFLVWEVVEKILKDCNLI